MSRRSRFVAPETVRLALSEGDWIEVKRYLTVGEARTAFGQVVGEIGPDGWRRPNLNVLGLSEVAAYLVDWSFRDAQDKPVVASLETIKALDEATFKEIDQALDAHKAAMEAALEAEKKQAATSSAPAAT